MLAATLRIVWIKCRALEIEMARACTACAAAQLAIAAVFVGAWALDSPIYSLARRDERQRPLKRE